MNSLEFRCRHQYASSESDQNGFVLDLEFASSRRVNALFGPSGSGKTTVLALIAGFLKPSVGTIRLTEPLRILTEVSESRHHSLPPDQRGIGFVFQEHRLFPHLTVEKNLRYGEKRPGRRIAIDFRRAIEVLELGPLLGQFPRQLSGGESQRVALGRALLSAPDLLLMDEPLASLDEPLKQRILNYLERVVAEWNLSVLFVSHSQADVRRLAEWVVVIQAGRLVSAGTPNEVFGTPQLLSWPSAVGPTNLLRLDRLEARENVLHAEVNGQSLSIPPATLPSNSPLYVQFSPRDVVLSLHEVTGVSARNHLRGTIRQIVETPAGVFVAVDVGQMLWAELTQGAVIELQLRTGLEVICLIKAHSLQVIE